MNQENKKTLKNTLAMTALATAIILGAVYGPDILVGDTFANCGGKQITTTIYGASIKTECDDYSIYWDIEDLGKSPIDSKYYLQGILKSKGIDRTIDFAIISPKPFTSASKVFITVKDDASSKRRLSYSCPSGDYGWTNFTSKRFYCTQYTGNGSYIDNSQASNDYYVDTQNNIIYWNETSFKQEYKQIDITSQFNAVTKPTEFGNYIYYARVTMKADKEYGVALTVDVAAEDIPVKYSIVIGDISTNTLYYVLDPTLSSSTTFTNTADWTGATQTNTTTLANAIKLNNSVNISKLMAYWRFDESSGEVKDEMNNYNSTTSSPGYASRGSTTQYKINRSVQTSTTASTSDIGDVGDLQDMSSTGYTFGAWAYNTCKQTTNTMGILSKFGTGTAATDLSYNFGLDYSTQGWTYWYQATDDTAISVTTGNGAAWSPDILNRWNFVVGVMNATHVQFWINGVRNNSASRNSKNPEYNAPNTFLGSNQRHYTWCGYLDEVFVFNRSLNGNEIRKLYNLGNGRTYPFYEHAGLFDDAQGWTAGSGKIKNITIDVTLAQDSSANFLYSQNTTSYYTQALSSGSNFLALNYNPSKTLYYKFQLYGNDRRTPQITSYTILSEILSSTDSLKVESPTTATPLSVVPSQNITVRYNITVSGSAVSSGVTFKNATIDGGETYWCPVRKNLACSGTAQVCSLYPATSACTDAGCTINAGSALTHFTTSFEATTGDYNNWTAGTSWARVTAGSIRTGSASAEIDGAVTDSSLTSQTFNLASYAQANVSAYILIETGVDAGEFVCMDYTCDGTNWNQATGATESGVGGLCQNGDVDTENSFREIFLDIDSACGSMPSAFNIRFRATVNGATEDSYVDDVTILAQSAGTCTGTPTACSARTTSTTCALSTGCTWSRSSPAVWNVGSDWYVNITINNTALSGLHNLTIKATYSGTDYKNNSVASLYYTPLVPDTDWRVYDGATYVKANTYFGLYDIEFRGEPSATEIEPTDQVAASTLCLFRVYNNGTVDGNGIDIWLNSSLTGVTVKADDDTTYAGAVTLTTSPQKIYTATMTPTSSKDICIWADYDAGPVGGRLAFNVNVTKA